MGLCRAYCTTSSLCLSFVNLQAHFNHPAYFRNMSDTSITGDTNDTILIGDVQ